MKHSINTSYDTKKTSCFMVLTISTVMINTLAKIYLINYMKRISFNQLVFLKIT